VKLVSGIGSAPPAAFAAAVTIAVGTSTIAKIFKTFVNMLLSGLPA
jgi:hypothetical protein